MSSKAHGVAFDASNPASIEQCAQQAVQTLGGLDGLVNNAAVTDSGGKGMDDIALDKWDQVMNVNVRGVWLMTRACRAALKDSGRGAIVNLASDTAMWGAPNLMAYVASKGNDGHDAFHGARAGRGCHHHQCRGSGWCWSRPPVRARAPPSPLHRPARAAARAGAEDVSGAVSYLLSDGARFVTGRCCPSTAASS
jgi:NAD(P)-dependent dehydrogenase (short-subunit alcohol dehydrogenase family)